MVQSDLEAENPLIDISIDTSNAEMDAEVAHLLETQEIGRVVKRTLQAVNLSTSMMLALMITGDAEMQKLNRQYRQQDKPTDVLSFPLLDEPLVQAPVECLWQIPEGVEENTPEQADASKPLFVTPAELATHLGDIVISWPTVQRQASAAGHTTVYELFFLLCHGVLHLVGYDDQTEAGYIEMVRLQTEILTSLKRES